MSITKIETVILQNLLYNEEYLRKVIPFLKRDYFTENNERKLFDEIKRFIDEYNTLPSKDALVISFQNDKSLTEDQYNQITELTINLEQTDSNNNDWLLKETEKFCKDKALYNAILSSISIIDGRDKTHSADGIPQLLQDALGVCFDNNVGHDYIDNASDRYDFYHRVESRIPFDLEYFNKITNGGLPNKTLNVVLAGTGVGKSLFMCHVAASVLAQSKNVLYITLEMAEERIAERIDSNLMNVTLDQLKDLPKQLFDNRIDKIKEKTHGRLIIKEYPTASAHTGHFKALLNELKLKRQFKPDMIIVDYLNICSSSRFKAGSNINSYTLVKSIAEELRGLAVEENVPILSATQTTRGGYGNTDVELTDTSESFGLPATVDFMFALIATEEMDQLNQIMVKQLKNRYSDPTQHKRFVVGIDRARMKLFDLEQNAQNHISDSGVNIKGNDLDTINIMDSFFKRNKDFSGIKI
jgi:replicative DNA helicase